MTAPPQQPVSSVAVRDLRVTFATAGGGRILAVDGVSLELRAGEIVGLVGESGSGKTTVARVLVGLLPASSGEVCFDGAPAPRRGRAERRGVQLVFQDPYASLNPRRSIRSVLRELLKVHGIAEGEAAERRAVELLALVGLPASALDRRPAAFSGGQRQRIAIARALAVEPRLIVADEPVSALDVSVGATILALFSRLRDELGLGLLLISHNLAVVAAICDRVAVMYLGAIVESGPRAAVFDDPRHPYTRALLDAAPRLHERSGAGASVGGETPAALARPAGCPFHDRCPRAEEICAEVAPVLEPLAGAADRLAACHFKHERPPRGDTR